MTPEDNEKCSEALRSTPFGLAMENFADTLMQTQLHVPKELWRLLEGRFKEVQRTGAPRFFERGNE